jgi:hypothetical protein
VYIRKNPSPWSHPQNSFWRTDLYNATAGQSSQDRLDSSSKVEYTGWIQGQQVDCNTPSEIRIKGQTEWEHGVKAEMSITDSDGKPDMQVLLSNSDGASTLEITNGSGYGKAAVEIPLSTSFEGREIPAHSNIGKVAVLQTETFTGLALYPIDDNGRLDPQGVIVYRSGHGALFMEPDN